jgi:hypothetical protein
MKPFIVVNQMSRFLVFVSFGMMLFSCNYVNGHTISGSGKVVKQERPVSSFSRLDIAVPLNVVIIPSKQNRVVVEIDDNLQSYVRVVSNGSLLSISLPHNTNFSTKVKGEIDVYVDSLSVLDNHSVGMLTMQDTLHTSYFALNNHAVGKTNLQIEANVISINNHAVGRLNLYLQADSLSLENHAVGETVLIGKCNEAMMSNQSVGNFDAKLLFCQVVHLTNSAVGGASIRAAQSFYIKNSGIGGLTLYGKGHVEELSDSGISKTRRADN